MADGQIGFIVQGDDGKIAVQLDRKAERLVVKFNPTEWVPVNETPLAPMHVARIAYVADRELRVARGEYGVPQWDSLREDPRVNWLHNGPPKSDVERCRLHTAILRAIASVT